MHEQEEISYSQDNGEPEQNGQEYVDSAEGMAGNGDNQSGENLPWDDQEIISESIEETEKTGDQTDTSKEDLESPVIETQPESKVRSFFRRFLRWTAGLLIVFGLGLIAGIYGLYRPAIRESDQMKTQFDSEIQSANEKTASLENQIKELNSKISELQPYIDENEKLIKDQNELELNIAILKTRLDIANATLAISNDDTAQAKLILENTNENLDRINNYLAVDQQEVIQDLKTRLEWVIEAIGVDMETAQTDLSVIGAKLIQLEDALINK